MKKELKARTFIDDVPVFCAFDDIIDISELKPNPKNPNTHPREQLKLLAEVIKKTGWRATITVSTLSGLIVKGHGRLYAAQLAGFKKCPVEYQEFKSEDEELSALLADNKLAELAEIDTEKLAGLFRDFNFEDLSLTGYSKNEWNDLISDFEDVEFEEEEKSLRPEGEVFTKSGDVWILGRHKLICGDSTFEDTYKKLLGNELVDLVLTDPPYNVDYRGGTADKLTIKNDNMSDEEFEELLHNAFSCMNEVMKDGAGFYIWHSDTGRYSFQKACQDVGLPIKQCLIWVKNQFVLGMQDYQWKHEPCLYGWKPGAGHYFTDDRTNTTVFDDSVDFSKLKRNELENILNNLFGEKCPTTVLYYDKPLKNEEHPTMKPVELFAQLIENSSACGDVILDNFAGSGTTLIAAHQMNRTARLIELDEGYCDVIVRRFIKNFPNETVKCLRDDIEIDWFSSNNFTLIE